MIISTTVNPNVDGYEKIANTARRIKKNKGNTETKSKYLGVCYNKRNDSWVSYIYYNGKRKTLGSYPHTDEGERNAALRYDMAAATLGLPTNILKPVNK